MYLCRDSNNTWFYENLDAALKDGFESPINVGELPAPTGEYGGHYEVNTDDQVIWIENPTPSLFEEPKSSMDKLADAYREGVESA